MTVERDPLQRVRARALDEIARLNEHAARTGGGVKDYAVLRLDHIDDGLHDRRWRKELAVVVCAFLRELGEEIFVDATEHVARGPAQCLGIEGPHHLFQDVVLEARVVFWQLSGERRKVSFHTFHGGGHGRSKLAILRQPQQYVVARSLGQHQGATSGKVGFDKWAVRHCS